MVRSALACLAAAFASLATWSAWADAVEDPGSDTPALTFDLMIDGEIFQVEANRRVTLKSQKKPGVAHDVAVQIAMEQHVKLDHLQFDYDWPATVRESRQGTQRSVQIRHELGFTLILTELGQAMDAKGQEQTLKVVSDSVSRSLRESGMKNIVASTPHEGRFANCEAHGVTLRCEDSKGDGQTGRVYVVTGPNFSASCIVQNSDTSAENVLPRVKKILDSIRPVAPKGDR